MIFVSLGKSNKFADAPSKCACLLFLPIPRLQRHSTRHFTAHYIAQPIDEQHVTFDEQNEREFGLPPKMFLQQAPLTTHSDPQSVVVIMQSLILLVALVWHMLVIMIMMLNTL